MISQAKVDRQQFDKAIELYMKNTSKSTVAAINGKARDLLYQAYKNTDYAKWNKSYILNYYRQTPRIITTICNTTYGAGNWGWKDWSYVLNKVASNATKSKSYMRSGFVKAAKMVAATEASKALSLTGLSKKFGNVHSQIAVATANSLAFESKSFWGASDGLDAAEKEQILDKAIQAGVRGVTRDIAKYLQNKLDKYAKAVSGR